ncbi:GNAT family N-acetyltransferase [Oceaniglobus trochenteri]|uniref:GNAT family N-acetyltransferase n=1 Tax=Oceaniglobus trochenteri TaxID=2763260 RepID=UPI001CFFD36A|nr:GNAT family N-acetyltransferase [Oceaniglobus trochenteri]
MIALRALGAEDAALVAELQSDCADYIALETGQAPGPAHVAGFFDDAPPGLSADQIFAMAICEGERPIGLLNWSQGYPETTDAYIGLLMLVPTARGRGIGGEVLSQVIRAARNRHCTRLLLCVFRDNPAALRFWQAHGFRHRQTTPPATFGARTHIRDELSRAI